MSERDSPGELLGAIFSASPDAVVVVDESGMIVLSSPAVSSLFGYYPEELVGESIEVLLPTERWTRHADHMRGFFGAPRSRQMGAGLELAGRHRDGSEFPVDVSLAPVEVRDRRYAAAFVRDAGERQRTIDRLHAVNEITRRLFEGTNAREILPLVAQSARRLTRSEAVWIVTPSPSGALEISCVDGPGTETLLGVLLSPETSRSAAVMRSRTAEVISDLSVAENVPEQVVPLDLGPGLYVPLIADERRLGTLVIARSRGRAHYSAVDVAFAEVFASAIAAAIEIGEVRVELDRLDIVHEDERIARDLHDTVIQQLFAAIGLSLQAARASATGTLGERIDVAVVQLDGVIREIRETIFRLPGRNDEASGLRDAMLRLADEYASQFGFTPRVAFHGAVDASVPEAVAAHLLQVLAESFSNVARHASATAVEAVISVEDGWLCFSLVDDGIGMGDGPRAGSGLRNMATRASDLGGTFTIASRDPYGTLLEWRVPI